MKRKLLLMASLAICVATIATGTLAYFNAEDKAHNVITTNGISIAIEEWQKTDGGALEEYPKDEPIKVMPGTVVSKIATVRNLQAESYIRAKIEVVFSKGSPSNAMELSEETLARLVTVEINDDDWVRKAGDTEWWYYKDSVKTGDVTTPLFEEVRFSGPNMTNEYQNCKIEVNVSAEAVQAANNKASATNALGWPTE